MLSLLERAAAWAPRAARSTTQVERTVASIAARHLTRTRNVDPAFRCVCDCAVAIGGSRLLPATASPTATPLRMLLAHLRYSSGSRNRSGDQWRVALYN